MFKKTLITLKVFLRAFPRRYVKLYLSSPADTGVCVGSEDESASQGTQKSEDSQLGDLLGEAWRLCSTPDWLARSLRDWLARSFREGMAPFVILKS